ncbi:MAG: hypothetical protein WCO67_23725, partial [Betaproteobacteria bacterium]
MPRPPDGFAPQHWPDPSSVTPHVSDGPALIAPHRRPPFTEAGVAMTPPVEPTPIWPDWLLPQQYALPSAVTPHVWSVPAVRLFQKIPPATCTGVVLSVVEPSPNCPLAFTPQQKPRPVVVTAQVWVFPAL